MEGSEVQYGRTRIPYAIRRSTRRGTVAVAVEPTGEVLLTAPTSTPIERLDRVVHEKAQWIVERWRVVRASPTAMPRREFVSGETFYYLGRQYRLVVRRGRAHVRLHRGQLEVHVPDSGTRVSEHVRLALVNWYREHATERLAVRVSSWAPKVGVKTAEILVREQQKRWASCDSSGTLRFNWRIVQTPSRLLDYVVVHELVHLHHRDHTSAYWAALGRAMPDYEGRRDELRRWGPRTIW